MRCVCMYSQVVLEDEQMNKSFFYIPTSYGLLHTRSLFWIFVVTLINKAVKGVCSYVTTAVQYHHHSNRAVCWTRISLHATYSNAHLSRWLLESGGMKRALAPLGGW